jgi:hypothetical protein
MSIEIPAGVYRARPITAALSKSKNGSEQAAVEFELTELESRRLTWFGSFSGGARDITLKTLRTLGWAGDDLADLSGIVSGAEDFEIKVEHEDYQGKTYTKIKWVNKIGGPALQNQMGQDEAKAFAARMKGAVVAFNKKDAAPKTNGAPPRQQPKQRSGGVLSPEPPPHTETEDIPF